MSLVVLSGVAVTGMNVFSSFIWCDCYWYECLAVLACDSLTVSTECIWRCEHAEFEWKFVCSIY